MTKEQEYEVYRRLSNVWSDLEHLKSRLYENDNDRADRNCPKLYAAQQLVLLCQREYTTWAEEES